MSGCAVRSELLHRNAVRSRRVYSGSDLSTPSIMAVNTAKFPRAP